MKIQFLTNTDNISCTLLIDHIPQDGLFENIPYVPDVLVDHRGQILHRWLSDNSPYEEVKKEDFDEFSFPDLDEQDVRKIRMGFNHLIKY